MVLVVQSSEVSAGESCSFLVKSEHSMVSIDNFNNQVCAENITSEEVDDCQHCCHCPSCHLTSLLPTGIHLAFVTVNKQLSVNTSGLQNIHHASLLRPPQI